MRAYRGHSACIRWDVLQVLTAMGRMACAQEMQYPVGAAVAEDGTVYIADRDFHGIWKFAGGKLDKYFEGSAKFRTPLNAVRCLAIDHQGKLLAGDSATRKVYRFDDAGQPVPLTKGNIGVPTAIAVRRVAKSWWRIRNSCSSGKYRRKEESPSSWPRWTGSSDCAWTRMISFGSHRHEKPTASCEPGWPGRKRTQRSAVPVSPVHCSGREQNRLHY